MAEHTPSPEADPASIEEQVFALSREGYETVGRLRSDFRNPYPEEHQRPDYLAMMAALGGFAANHIDQLDTIQSLPLPPDVEEAANGYLQQLLRDKLALATCEQYVAYQSEKIRALLAGRRITAQTLRNNGFMKSEGHGITSSGKKVVSGQFLGIELVTANIWIGRPDDAYRVSLWGRDFNVATRQFDPLKREVTLHVHK